MRNLLVPLRVGLRDLVDHRGLAGIMALSIAIAAAMATFLETYRAGLAAEFREGTTGMLVVHDNQNVGDITGSRIPRAAEERLTTLGLGSSEPVVDPVDADNRWKNRRVEFILEKK